MLKFYCSFIFFLTISWIGCNTPSPPPIPIPYPNIVYILADDMGYGDVSALNKNSKIKTTHLDALTEKGMAFTDAHSGSSLCTPTRYGILTGRYAWRTSLKRGVTWSYDTPIIPPSRNTVASLLKQKGYHTACVGKWHLGLGWGKDSTGKVDVRLPIQNGPNVNGFDYFFGIPASLDIPPYVYIENDRSTTTQIDTIEKNDGKGFWRWGPIGDDLTHEDVLPTFTKKAVNYIEQQAKTDNPFFLYFPLPAPHTPILPTPEFVGKSSTNEYGDFVLMVDDVVGQVVEALEKNGVSQNTLIIFTTDNGCSPMANFEELKAVDHHPSYLYRGHKADIFEGGHRVPFLAKWPNQIKPQSLSNQLICHTDLMATVAAIVGDSLNSNEGEDSYNMLPTLTSKPNPASQREVVVHHSGNGAYALRKGKWKLAFCPGSGGWSFPVPKKAKELGLPPVQLYDLSVDFGETQNLQAENPEVVKELTALMETYIREGRSTPGEVQENDTETLLYLE